MATTKKNKFNPNYALHPGSTLQDLMEYYNMDSRKLSVQSKINKQTIEDILKYKGKITQDIAEKLFEVFGVSVEFWMNKQKHYNKIGKGKTGLPCVTTNP